jgi:hypothetical protein
VSERRAAEVAASLVALVLRAFGGRTLLAAESLARPALEVAGEALAAALDEDGAAEVARVAAGVVDAPIGLVWEPDGAGMRLAGAYGVGPGADLGQARGLAAAALEETGPAQLAPAGRLPGGCAFSAAIPLGQPPVGVLQLLFRAGEEPDTVQLGRLTMFGVRAARAFRANARGRALAMELERTRALLAVVGQATAELSLAHTLETAVERVASLLGVDRVAVYLRTEPHRLAAAAGEGLAGPHARVAERLLEAALGGGRVRTIVTVADARTDGRLRDVPDAGCVHAREGAWANPRPARRRARPPVRHRREGGRTRRHLHVRA